MLINFENKISTLGHAELVSASDARLWSSSPFPGKKLISTLGILLFTRSETLKQVQGDDNDLAQSFEIK